MELNIDTRGCDTVATIKTSFKDITYLRTEGIDEFFANQKTLKKYDAELKLISYRHPQHYLTLTYGCLNSEEEIKRDSKLLIVRFNGMKFQCHYIQIHEDGHLSLFIKSNKEYHYNRADYIHHYSQIFWSGELNEDTEIEITLLRDLRY